MLLKPRSRRPIVPHVRVGCAFCWEWIPQPRKLHAYDPSGVWGGRCPCGAWFVLDENGKQGGQSLLELTTLACDGDVDRGLGLRADEHYELRHKPMVERLVHGAATPNAVTADPKVWFLMLLPAGRTRGQEQE